MRNLTTLTLSLCLTSMLGAGTAAAQQPAPAADQADPAATDAPTAVDEGTDTAEPAEAEAPADQAQPPPPAPAAAQPPPPMVVEDKDGVRFRGGVSLAGGGLLGSEEFVDYSGFLVGVSGHIGVQIFDLFALYAVPHLSFGSVTFDAGPVQITEGWLNFSATGLIDFTIIDQIFVAAGGGWAAHAPTCTNCNSATGPAIHFRLGGYPLMDYGDDGIRRMGLMISGDMRVNLLSVSGGENFVMYQPMLNVGYEAF